MATRDLVHRIVDIPSIVAGAALVTQSVNTGGANSSDTLGYESATIILRAHTLTAGTIQLMAQDSPDGTTWGSLADTSLVIPGTAIIGGAYPAALSAAGTIMIGLTGVGGTAAAPLLIRRFIRAVAVMTGYSGIMSADIILSHPRHSGSAV